MKLRYQVLSIVLLLGIGSVFISAGLNQRAHIPTVEVELEKMGVLYNSLENPLSVGSREVAASDLVVTISGGGARLDTTHRPGHFIIRVSAGTQATLNVGMKKGNEVISLGSYVYRIKRTPDPITYVGFIKNDGSMLKKDLLALNVIHTRMENFDFECVFTPVSFSMSVIENGAWKEYKAESNALTPEMKAALEKTKVTDRIMFHNVTTKGPDGTLRKVNPVMITVK